MDQILSLFGVVSNFIQPGWETALAFLKMLPVIFSVGEVVLGSAFATLLTLLLFAALYFNTGKKLGAAAKVTFFIVLPYVLVIGLFKAWVWLDAHNASYALWGPFLALVVWWHTYPHWVMWTKIDDMPKSEKFEASKSFLAVTLKGLFQWPFDLLAWFVVPLIVIFTPRSAEKLPGFFEKLWGDVNGLHGDNVWWVHDVAFGDGIRYPVPQEIRDDVIAMNYFLKGVWQRTYASMVTWLTRNRSTNLAAALGITVNNFTDYFIWGTKTKIGNGPGGGFGVYVLKHRPGVYEIHGFYLWVSVFGKQLARRLRHGYKLSNVVGPYADMKVAYRRPRVEIITTALAPKGYKTTIDPTREILGTEK